MDTLIRITATIFFSGFLAFLSEKNAFAQPKNSHEVQEVIIDSIEKSKSKSDLLIEEALKHLGTKYRYGGKSPKGFDCSGFTQYIFKKQKIQLARSAREQSKQGKKIKLSKAKKGDLLFFGTKKSISHVGIVISKSGKPLTIIHSATSQGIVTTDIEASKYWSSKMRFAKRLF